MTKGPVRGAPSGIYGPSETSSIAKKDSQIMFIHSLSCSVVHTLSCQPSLRASYRRPSGTYESTLNHGATFTFAVFLVVSPPPLPLLRLQEKKEAAQLATMQVRCATK